MEETLKAISLFVTGYSLPIIKQFFIHKSQSKLDKDNRDFSVKREAFINYLESATRSSELIALTLDTSKPLPPDHVSNAQLESNFVKLTLISNNISIGAASNFNKKQLELLMKAYLKRIDLEAQDQEIKSIDNSINLLIEQRNNLYDRFEADSKQLTPEKVKLSYDFLVKQVDKISKEIDKEYSKKDILFKSSSKYKITAFKEFIRESKELSPLLAEVIVSLRKEIGIKDKSLDIFEEIIQKKQEHNQELLTVFFDELDNKINTLFDD